MTADIGRAVPSPLALQIACLELEPALATSLFPGGHRCHDKRGPECTAQEGKVSGGLRCDSHAPIKART
eukprot:scaffold80_cov382-Prasinococcus_capsulatus_cf.AAC.5